LTLEFEEFILIAAYSPFAGKKLERLNFKISTFEPALYEYCNRLKQKGKGIILCGDLNTAVHFKDTHFSKYTDRAPGFTKVERQNLSRFLKQGWVDTFRKLHPEEEKYSWWHIKHNGREKRIGRRFDYFLVTEDLAKAAIESDVLEDFISVEHSPILMKVDLFLKTDLIKCANFFWVHSKSSHEVITKP
jgi:exodeoxyribonuclease-3